MVEPSRHHQTYVYVKRDSHIRQKRPTYMNQKDPYIRPKRPIYTPKETQTHIKRGPNIRQKRPAKRNQYKVKRDTDISIKKNNKAHKCLVGFIFLFYPYMSCNKLT